MSQAETFRTVMWDHIKRLAQDEGAGIKVEAGIVVLTFPDGTVLDFTEPLSKAKK